jgi:hypothetical protein
MPTKNVMSVSPTSSEYVDDRQVAIYGQGPELCGTRER